MADDAISTLVGGGYDPAQPWAQNWMTSIGHLVTAYRKVRVWIPPDPGFPAVPDIKPRVDYITNNGWNTQARSINPLVRGQYYDFNCSDGIYGAFLGIAKDLKDMQKTSLFTHALIVDRNGVTAYESGEAKRIIKSHQKSISNIRIYRQEDDSIVYVVTTGTESLVYTSTERYREPSAYIYGYLYSSGDKILSSSFKSGKVVYGSV